MNQVILLGRVVRFEDTTEYGKEACVVTLVTPRPYKNEEGIYEEDFFDVVLRSSNMISNTKDYIKKGDLVGIKGVLEMFVYTKTEGEKEIKMRKTLIVANKVTFLSSNASSINESSEEESDED